MKLFCSDVSLGEQHGCNPRQVEKLLACVDVSENVLEESSAVTSTENERDDLSVHRKAEVRVDDVLA